MAKEIRQTLFWRTARPFQTIRGCLLCCEEVLGAVWKLFLLVAHFHLSNRHVCHKHGGVVQIQSRSLVPCYCPLSRRNVMKTDTWHVDVGSGKSVWKTHKGPCWAVMFALERVVFIPFLSLSCLFLFSVSQTDLSKPSAYRMPDLACLFLSQLVVKPQLGLALLLVLFHTSLFVSSFFPQIFHQSLSPPRLTALIFHCGDRASFLGSCQCSAGCQYWTTMTRCSSFSLTFLLSFASWKSETDEDMPAKNDLNSVVVISSELSSVISPGKTGVFVFIFQVCMASFVVYLSLS